jgi:response regulator of citrate/malate metabolism
MNQLTITFEPPHNGTATSRAAADSMRGHAPRLKRQILAQIATADWGLTCDEVEQRTGLSHQTASARIRELLESDSLYHHGTRSTRSGRQARVYFVRSGR